jgi:hypothetical protein
LTLISVEAESMHMCDRVSESCSVESWRER